MLSQDAEVGVKCRWKRGCALSQRFTAGVLCVAYHILDLRGGFTYNFKNPDTQYQSGIEPCRLRLPIPRGLGASATAAVSHPPELPG